MLTPWFYSEEEDLRLKTRQQLKNNAPRLITEITFCSVISLCVLYKENYSYWKSCILHEPVVFTIEKKLFTLDLVT